VYLIKILAVGAKLFVTSVSFSVLPTAQNWLFVLLAGLALYISNS